MGEINESEHLLAQEGTADVWPLPKVGATVQGLALPIGLKAVPFLDATGPTPAADLVEVVFKIPMRDASGKVTSHRPIMVDLPKILVDAWAAEKRTSIELQCFEHMNEALERAEERDLRTRRCGDHLAGIIDLAYACMDDQARAVAAVPTGRIGIGELMTSATAWWDQERDK